jgi:hypothetical protein
MPPELAIEIELREEAHAAENGNAAPVVAGIGGFLYGDYFDLDGYLMWLIYTWRQAACREVEDEHDQPR